MDVSICGLTALQGWLCVLRAHDRKNGNIFMQLFNNILQGGTKFHLFSYSAELKHMGESCGVNSLMERSVRRGGAGYHYIVLTRDFYFMFRAFAWNNRQEMMRYIGFEEVHNSFALLSFKAFGTNELYFPMHASVFR